MALHEVRPLPAMEEARVEPLPKPGFPHELYPRWVGHKFEADGRLLPFPGHTIICHVPPQSELFQALSLFYQELEVQSFAAKYAFLPPASWHMTVFEGVSDQIRKRSSWPGEVPLDAPLSACTEKVREQLTDFDMGCELPFRMAIEGWEPLEDGIALKVVPSTPLQERTLRGLRDQLSDHLQMQHPGHGTYSFHISLSYLLQHLEQHETEQVHGFLHNALPKLPKQFELEAPEFCTFEDMFEFQREFSLR